MKVLQSTVILAILFLLAMEEIQLDSTTVFPSTDQPYKMQSNIPQHLIPDCTRETTNDFGSLKINSSWPLPARPLSKPKTPSRIIIKDHPSTETLSHSRTDRYGHMHSRHSQLREQCRFDHRAIPRTSTTHHCGLPVPDMEDQHCHMQPIRSQPHVCPPNLRLMTQNNHVMIPHPLNYPNSTLDAIREQFTSPQYKSFDTNIHKELPVTSSEGKGIDGNREKYKIQASDGTHLEPALVLASMARQIPVRSKRQSSGNVQYTLDHRKFVPLKHPPRLHGITRIGTIPQREISPLGSSQNNCNQDDLSSSGRIHRLVSNDDTVTRKRPSETAALEYKHNQSMKKVLNDTRTEQWFSGAFKIKLPFSADKKLACLEMFTMEYLIDDPYDRLKSTSKIDEHQVGVRCLFCNKLSHSELLETQAVFFPLSITYLYDSMKNIIQKHIPICNFTPESIKIDLDHLKQSSRWTDQITQSCRDSVQELDIKETNSGLRFACPPPRDSEMDSHDSSSLEHRILFPEDKGLVEPYVYLLLQQVEVCYFSQVDMTVARSKGTPGSPGIQCRHCRGLGGNGKYFPVSLEALVVNSMTQNLHSHLMKCIHCPHDVQSDLRYWKGRKTKEVCKRPGWRKDFFTKLWERLHGKTL